MSEVQYMLDFGASKPVESIAQSQEAEYDPNWKFEVEADSHQRKTQLKRHLGRARSETPEATFVTGEVSKPGSTQKPEALPKRKDNDSLNQAPKSLSGEAAKDNLARLNANFDRRVASGAITLCHGCQGWITKGKLSHCDECQDDKPTLAKRKANLQSV